MHHFIHWLAISAFIFFDYTSPYTESAYPIDEKPMIDIDTSFYGKYYLAENPEKTDHFTIEKGYTERNYIWSFGREAETTPSTKVIVISLKLAMHNLLI